MDEPFNVVWKPLPGSQTLAVTCPCNVLLYEGSRGPGKTDAQLMFFHSHVGKGYGSAWRGVIFDREYKNLDDLIAKSERWFGQFHDGARFLRSKGDYKWVWPTGEELLFRQLKKESDYWNYHGQEFPFIGWNELSKFATGKMFDLMFSCNRTGFIPLLHTPKHDDGTFATKDGKILPEIPLIVFATTNPYGPGHGWVKRRFIDTKDADGNLVGPGEVLTTTTNVYNPRTGKREDITRTQTRLFASYKENIYLSPQYVAVLESIKEPNRRRAWLHGDWNITAGGMFDDLWNEMVHIVDNFKVPKGWKVSRAFDWGSSHPFSVGWYCIANGETITLNNGRKWTPNRGSVIRFAEWYGCVEGAENEGIKLSGPEIAAGIMAREMAMLQKGTIATIPDGGPADGQIFQERESDVATIGSKMAEEGIDWIAADKSKGSRVNGWQLIRDALTNALRGEGPGLFFTKGCPKAIELLPSTPRDEEDLDDVDTLAEDHIQDEVRYFVLDASVKWSGSLKVSLPT